MAASTLPVGGNSTNYWTLDGGNIGINTTNNVGIGTISAVNSLNILGNVGVGTISYSNYLKTAAPSGGAIFEGNVGIGTWAPGNSLDVAGGNIGIGTAYNLIGIGTTSTILTLRTDSTSIYVGIRAGASTTAGSLSNAAVGYQALVDNTIGNNNSALGIQALNDNTSGNNNSAMGSQALFWNSLGGNNSAFGYSSLEFIGDGGSTPVDNTAIGYNAGSHVLSGGLLTNLSQSTFLGDNTEALLNGDANETVIGYNAIGNGSNTVTLGSAAVVSTILQGNIGVGTFNPFAGKLIVTGGNVGIGSLVPGQVSGCARHCQDVRV